MEPPIKMHSQNDETRNEHWYFSMLNTKHYQIIPALSPICGSGIYQLSFKVLQFANHWRHIHVTRHGSGIPKNSSYVGHEEKKLTVFSQWSWLFCAQKKSTQIHWYIWYAERTWSCHLHSRNATRNSPIKKRLLGMLWWNVSAVVPWYVQRLRDSF